MDSIAAISLADDPVQVTCTKQGLPYNPTSDTVQFAYLANPPTAASPQPSDYVTATWETITNPTGATTYNANCLIGPGGTKQLAVGTWYRWVKITDNPEIPAIPAGTLTVF